MTKLRAAPLLLSAVFTITLVAPHKALAYSGLAAAQYADEHSLSCSSYWPCFTDDCTNFVSQAMYYGNIKMRNIDGNPLNDANWYMQGSITWSWSHSWTVVADHDIFITSHLAGVTNTAAYYGAYHGVSSYASPGDVVYYDWTTDGHLDHAAIIVTSDGESVDAHTTDHYHVYWTLADFNSQWPTTTVEAYHIPQSTT